MSRILALALVFGLVFAAAPMAQNDVSGSWDLAINGPEGPISAGAMLKQDGDKVSGMLSSPQGETPVSGTISGKTMSLSLSVSTPQGVLEIRVTAEVDGTEMKGMMDFGMGQADFTGKRK